ncbi:MAG: site-2 protease family protein [Tepidiformaceae bacterium]
MLRFYDQFSDNPSALVAYIAAFCVAFVTGIAFHEFSHAWTANELGDDTAKRLGRVSLNPIRHLDPLGTILLLLIGFGWGKPTPVNPYRLRNGVKRGNLIVAAAGPLSNFFFAALAALPLKLGLIDSVASFENIRGASGVEIFGLFLVFTIYINVLLGVFNLIPIAPLDGFKVAVGLLPDQLSRELDKLSKWGPGILMSLFVLSWVAPQYNVLGWFLGRVSSVIFDVIV